MKAIENLERLFKINKFKSYTHDPIFIKFKEIKEIEKNYHEFLCEKDINSLNLDEIKEIDKAVKTLCRESYYSYFKQCFPTTNPLVLGEHIELICDVLTLAEMGLFEDVDTKSRIAISVPPRHLKSTAITNNYPSWFMGKRNFRSVIVTSYGDNLVKKAGQKNKEKIKTLGKEFFGVELKKDVAKKGEWELQKGNGRFIAATVRGGATGEGAELLIIDDPVKNREEANSLTKQESIWNEYQEVFLTRMHNHGIIIIIMTRWHNLDLRGKIDAYEKNVKWLKLDLMAMCETEEECREDALGRGLNQALYPQMFDEKYFEPFKRNPRTWWSLYKQRPQVDTGEYFTRDYFQYFTFDSNFVTLYKETGVKQFLIKDCTPCFQTVDTAQKKDQKNDETAILTVVITPENDLLFLDLYHGRIEVPEQEKMLDKYWNKWSVDFQAIEDKQSGTGLIQKLLNEGRPIKVLVAKNDKVERSTAIQLYYANSKVYHLSGASWVDYFETQLLQFPNATHDDTVDCASYAGIVVSEKESISSII